ncbi:MAG: class II fumarate hydratase [Thermodesulfovibrionia bacterium]|nr:class II fumarate hydratase [Thermodesulfovibrionia bacterium]
MRIEHDTLGEVKLPDKAYYGAQTQRAVENFPISGLRLPRRFIRAQGIVKLAAARANGSFGLLKKNQLTAIEKAALEVIEGMHDAHFVVDAYQAGAGTSQNMNANEVICNRAVEILKGKRGDHSKIHPNDHVNMAQSTNDTIPTSICISSFEALKEGLLPALRSLKIVLSKKAKDFDRIVKAGRTHMQDAVPIRLGQEFSGYAEAVANDIKRIENASKSLLYIPIGGNAVGTGINAHPKFRQTVVREINKITGIKFKSPANRFEGIQNVNAALEVSASLRGIAVTLTKISNDIRLLSSGPRTGFAEIILPAVQPGSSIMPGKVNPVMAEMLNMICYQVMGNDTTITFAMQAGQLELNVMKPLIAYNLLTSIEILTNGVNAFNDKCLKGIKADAKRCRELADATLAIATALNPVIGYEAAAAVSKEAYNTGKTVKQVVIEKGILNKKDANRLLDPMKLTGK